MPDINSIGLGGGSRVRVKPDGHVTVGPDSVGHYVRHEVGSSFRELIYRTS
jgi:N-methylhydantoinase A/oxoprolinase/acetone carboxylase beta subunit